jgi:hypothetical protein
LIVKGVRRGLGGFQPAKEEDWQFFRDYRIDDDMIVEQAAIDRLIQKQNEKTKEVGEKVDDKKVGSADEEIIKEVGSKDMLEKVNLPDIDSTDKEKAVGESEEKTKEDIARYSLR